MTTYKIKRFYALEAPPDADYPVLPQGLTEEQAQAWCKNPETSSKTTTKAESKRHTKRWGAWFDGYEREGQE